MALRTSTQVMSLILSVFGSGAVSGRLAIVSASTLDTAATRASLSSVCRREGVAGSGSDIMALRPAQSRRSVIVGGDAFEDVNPRLTPVLSGGRGAELRAPLRRHGGTRHFLAAQIDLVDPAGVADLLERIGVEHDEVGVAAGCDQPGIDLGDLG